MWFDTPYVSQLDPATGSGGNNCGPACLAMMLAHDGVIAPDFGAMLEIADVVRDGVLDGRGRTGEYTSWGALMGFAAGVGRPAVWCDSWGAIHAGLAAGQPVMILLSNWHLYPRQYPATSAWNAHHFVILSGYDADRDAYRVNDPLSLYARGPAEYTGHSVRVAVDDIGAVQGFYLEPVSPEPTATPEITLTPEDDMACQEELAAVRDAQQRADAIKGEFETYLRDSKHAAKIRAAARKAGMSHVDYMIERAK